VKAGGSPGPAAAGYLLKDAEPEDLLTGIRAAARGEALLAPKAAAVILGLGERRPAHDLSAREREVDDRMQAALWARRHSLIDGGRCRPPMSSVVRDSLGVMVKEFDAQLHKGDNPGAWTCVVMDDAATLFGTRGLVKIRGAIDGQPFDGALMAQGDGTHRLPVKAKLRKAIGKEAGDTVHVRIDERIS
jgi:hypothetical protein